MKKFLAIFILCFTTSSQADDIRDFQIEGISIGDSALDYIERDKLISKKKIGLKVINIQYQQILKNLN